MAQEDASEELSMEHLRGCWAATCDGPCSCDEIEKRIDIYRQGLTEEWNSIRGSADLFKEARLFEEWIIKKISGRKRGE